MAGLVFGGPSESVGTNLKTGLKNGVRSYGRGEIWSRGYCVSTVGLNEKAIMDYVEYQYKEDTGQLKLELGE